MEIEVSLSKSHVIITVIHRKELLLKVFTASLSAVTVNLATELAGKANVSLSLKQHGYYIYYVIFYCAALI